MISVCYEFLRLFLRIVYDSVEIVTQVTKLIALVAQKFVSDVAYEALQVR
jgi:hypothetical protein